MEKSHENLYERFQAVIDYFCHGSQTEFAKKTKISQSTLQRSVYEKAARPLMNLTGWVLLAFPEVSREWLLRGEGEMLDKPQESSAEIDVLRQRVNDLQDLISAKEESLMLYRERRARESFQQDAAAHISDIAAHELQNQTEHQ
jgi:hypothetical protein